MAKYTVTHTCGHDHEYQLIGKHTERERMIDRCISNKEGLVQHFKKQGKKTIEMI